VEPLRILIVDDNKEFCENVKDIMELQGHDVITAYDGVRALELVKQNHIDLVLLDMIMPGMDGLATQVRLKEIAPAIPVILVTAFGEEEFVGKALREGALGYFKKPIDFDHLCTFINDKVSL
jgi:DNA-binding NtrC family response regulator